jgi:hypothetical protein
LSKALLRCEISFFSSFCISANLHQPYIVNPNLIVETTEPETKI